MVRNKHVYLLNLWQTNTLDENKRLKKGDGKQAHRQQTK